MSLLTKKIKNKKGFTLLELLAVLIVMAIIAVGIYEMLKSSSMKKEVENEIRNANLIGDLSSQLATPNSATPYVNINESALITTNQVPNIQNSQIMNVWGGIVTVRPLSLNSGTNNAFSVTENGVPKAACSDFAFAAQSSFLYININGKVVMNTGSLAPIKLDPAQVTANCTSTTNIIMLGRA